MRTRSDDLAILLAVVDCGGFSAAANTLNIQVARVSRAVTKVEQQLGASILNRTTRRIEVTEEGREFVASVRAGLNQLSQAESDIVSRGERPAGRLRVDAASPFVLHQLVPLVASFKQAFPDIELQISSNEAFTDLLEKHTDVAIRIGQLSDSSLHARLLGKSELFIVAAPEYLANKGYPKDYQSLLQHDLIGFADMPTLNIWPFPAAKVITPNIAASNGETIRQLTLAANGIACLSGFMVRQDLTAGRLVALLEPQKLTNTGREPVNAVYYRSSAVAKRISAFIDFISPRLSL
ncbi:LysR family transcriptional regulator [Motilimonas pumila]|uniref:LysR family transcriptional regulator n=1 Tax=Motilimonas pumila TaxID=2303987 RepID=A0A418YKG7_9GAMM|nr:LysR family transcriptional regulator [Motilimonas pumila]RJG51320.1 LysR family transcriptional regulator [Motilimonas pumila]